MELLTNKDLDIAKASEIINPKFTVSDFCNCCIFSFIPCFLEQFPVRRRMPSVTPSIA